MADSVDYLAFFERMQNHAAIVNTPEYAKLDENNLSEQDSPDIFPKNIASDLKDSLANDENRDPETVVVQQEINETDNAETNDYENRDSWLHLTNPNNTHIP